MPGLPKDAARFLENRIRIQEPNILVLACPEGCLEATETSIEIVNKRFPDLPVMVATNIRDPESLIRVLKSGAADFVLAPFQTYELVSRVVRLCRHRTQEDRLIEQLKLKLGLVAFVGQSAKFMDAIERIPVVAKCDANVLITGETGTGKEICARAIHYLSARAEKPFVPINCGAIPNELVENELFGHEPGAFTGATAARTGLIRDADGGTVFLDEIDCLPLQTQTKLLRLLQEKEFRALGSNMVRRADVRIVAASNARLDEAIRTGQFRRDLFYRINVVPISLPPLRERKDDIPLLARHFQAKYAAAVKKPSKELSSTALQKLMHYEWPGNVRELENIIERAVILCESCQIHGEDISLPGLEAHEITTFKEAKAKAVADFEKRYLGDVLVRNNGNITHAARAAHKARRAFWQLLRKHKLTVSVRPKI